MKRRGFIKTIFSAMATAILWPIRKTKILWTVVPVQYSEPFRGAEFYVNGHLHMVVDENGNSTIFNPPKPDEGFIM